MNNIVKHINYEQFTQILGAQHLQKFLNNAQGQVYVFFIAQWSIPSRLTFKRIKKICINKKNIVFVDVDLVDNIELCQKYEITKVPHCIVMQNLKKQFEFIGLDIQKLNDVLTKLNVIEDKKKNIPQLCPKNHKYKCLKQLPNPPYVDNFFFCNHCKKVDKCDQKNMVLHCGECDYDLCRFCQISL